MRDASVPTPRRLLACLAILLTIPLAAPSAAAPAPDWVTLVQDDDAPAPGQAPEADPRVDVVEVGIADTPDALWLRLRTRASATAPAAQATAASEPTSTVEMEWLRWDRLALRSLRVVAEGDRLRVLVDGREAARVPLDRASGQSPWGYEVAIPRLGLLGDDHLEMGDRLQGAWARTERGGAPGMTDRAPDAGHAPPYDVRTPTGVADPLPTWSETVAVDHAAAPSLAVHEDGRAHVAYVVYNATRGAQVGLYHATFDASRPSVGEPPGWQARRVADVTTPTDLREERRVRTALALDPQGRPHVVFHPMPSSGRGLVRYATPDADAEDGWRIEDPARLVDGTRWEADDGHRGLVAVAAGRDRTLVAFQSGEGVTLVERVGPDAWRLVTRIEDARFPRLALDAGENAHVAWFGGARPAHDHVAGTLRYAAEAEGWMPVSLVDGLRDFGLLWDHGESDGGFDFALDPAGTPRFVWDADREEQAYGAWRDGRLEREPIPLRSSPQPRMRLAFDHLGRAHVLAGYDGAESYAVRTAQGVWLRQETWRQDMPQLALAPDGRAIMAGTQPHLATTLAFRAQTAPVGDLTPDEAFVLRVVQRLSALGEARHAPLAFAALAGAALAGIAFPRLRGLARPAWWGVLGAVGGFSRIGRPRVADHEAREAILRAVRDEPGLAASDLRRRLRMPRSTLAYHARRLEREGLLVTRRAGQRLLLLPPGARLAPDAALPPEVRALLDLVRHAPGKTTTDYARLAGVPRRTAAGHLAALERDGLVARASVPLRPRRWRAS